MTRITIDVDDDKVSTFLAFLKTLPYVKVVEDHDATSDFSALKVNTSNSEYQAGQAEELNNELNDFFGE